MGGEGGEVCGGELLDRGERDAGEERVGRGRSLSGTLGELWRGWRGGGELEGGDQGGSALGVPRVENGNGSGSGNPAEER